MKSEQREVLAYLHRASEIRQEHASPPMAELAVGSRVRCVYRQSDLNGHWHEGTLLAMDDPRAWKGSIAFGETVGLPNAEAVKKHVAWCKTQGLLNGDHLPVAWDFGKIYWDSQLLPAEPPDPPCASCGTTDDVCNEVEENGETRPLCDECWSEWHQRQPEPTQMYADEDLFPPGS